MHSYRQVHCDTNNADVLLVYKFDDHYDGLAPISYHPACGTNKIKISNGLRPQVYSDIHNHYYDDNGIWTRKLSNEKTDPQKSKTTIKIISWNIHGLNGEKLSQCIVGGFVKRFDIILLTETWSTAEQSYGLDGFQYYAVSTEDINIPSPEEGRGDRVCLYGTK